MIWTLSLNLTHQVEALVVIHHLVPAAAALAPAQVLVAPRVTLTLLATIPNISPHPSCSQAMTLMLLMKHGQIFVAHIPSPCATSGVSCVQSSTPMSSSLMKLLSVAN